MAATIRELIWLRWVLQDLGVGITSPTPLHCDSIDALQVAADPVKHELSKHVGVDAHFARCSVRDQIVSLHYLPSEVQVAVDPVKYELSKYVGVDAHFARCSVRDQIVSLHYLPSEVQVADFFTKAQTRAQHQFLLSKLKTLDPP